MTPIQCNNTAETTLLSSESDAPRKSKRGISRTIEMTFSADISDCHGSLEPDRLGSAAISALPESESFHT